MRDTARPEEGDGLVRPPGSVEGSPQGSVTDRLAAGAPPTALRPGGRADSSAAAAAAEASAAAATAEAAGEDGDAGGRATIGERARRLPPPVEMYKKLQELLFARASLGGDFDPAAWCASNAPVEPAEGAEQPVLRVWREFVEDIAHHPELDAIDDEPVCLRCTPSDEAQGSAEIGADPEEDGGCGCGKWGVGPLDERHLLVRCAWRGSIEDGHPPCTSVMHPMCMPHGVYCSQSCADAADREALRLEGEGEGEDEDEDGAPARPPAKPARPRSRAQPASSSMDADADDDAVDAEPPSDEATSKAFETLSMERPDDSEDVTAEVLLASRHAALRRLQPPAEAAADDGQGGEDGAAAEGEGVRRASRFQRTAINAAYRTLMLRHGYDPADDSSSAERSATAAQVDLARKQAHLGELALPMAMIQLKAVQDIEKQAAVAPGVGTFTLEALADRARVVLLRAELAGSQAHDASELAAAQLAIVQQHISQGSVDAESSQDETAAVIKRDKTWVTKYKTACEHSDREVRRIVERVRRTLGRLEERLQEPTDEEAAALQNAVLAQQDAAHLTLNAETLLEAAAIEEERRQACRPFAESLLEAVQFDPFPAAAAAAAVAAGGASSAADAANSAAVGGAAAFTAATWASHERLQHEGMTLSTFLDARCVALLRLEQFSSTLVAYADGLFNRPSGARPKDLVESATVAVSIAVGDPAARQGVPGRKLLSKAKLCVAAIFAEDDDGDAARAALSHLQEQPCSSKKKGWCRLCITQASIGDRWEALAEVSGQPCHRGVDLFTHASARPSILVCNAQGVAAMQAGAALPDVQKRLLERRIRLNGHVCSTAACVKTKLLHLRACGFVECPTCARPLGEPNGNGLVAMLDACEPVARKRGRGIAFGGTDRSSAGR